MSKQLTYQLFELIKTLSKSEKRHFKLYTKRNLAKKQLIFITLFDVIDKMESYTEHKITERFPKLKDSLLSNHKAHLHEQILMSLRLLKHKTPLIRIKELISFADVLLQKGLHLQSLHQLSKAKLLAKTYHADVLRLEILGFEKLIESSYITRSHQKRASELVNESKAARRTIKSAGIWSDLSIKMYDYYLKFGHIKNENDFTQITFFFTKNLPQGSTDILSFYGKIYKSQSYVWFNYITLNFTQCYKHSLNWIASFDEFPEMKIVEPDLYMKGVHNSLSALFYCDEAARFEKELCVLKNYITNNQHLFNENQSTSAFIYLETAKLNLFFLKGNFSEGANYAISFEERLTAYGSKIDMHRVLILNYKIASLKFGGRDYKGAIKHLNFIINHPSLSLREDIQCFARILNLIAHYELGNDDLIEYQIKNTYKFLLKLKDMQKVQQAIFSFLKKSVHVDRTKPTPHFKALKDKLDLILKDKYEARPTLYLDITSWLESKISGKTVEQVIKAKKQTHPSLKL